MRKRFSSFFVKKIVLNSYIKKTNKQHITEGQENTAKLKKEKHSFYTEETFALLIGSKNFLLITHQFVYLIEKLEMHFFF